MELRHSSLAVVPHETSHETSSTSRGATYGMQNVIYLVCLPRKGHSTNSRCTQLQPFLMRRKVTVQLQKQTKSTLQHHQILRLPRKVTLQHQQRFQKARILRDFLKIDNSGSQLLYSQHLSATLILSYSTLSYSTQLLLLSATLLCG